MTMKYIVATMVASLQAFTAVIHSNLVAWTSQNRMETA